MNFLELDLSSRRAMISRMTGNGKSRRTAIVWLIAFLDSIVGFTRITICTIYIAHIYATPRHFSEHSAVHAVKPLRQ